MFERNIEETLALLRKETIEGADSITSRQIFASSMPLAIKRMFEADIDIWVREERERLLQSPHFRYDEEEMQTLFEQIGTRAREHAFFTSAEYTAALDKNVKLIFNYICRPQWTLVKYLFAEREHAAADDLLEALKIFWHYEYYQVILREYFEKKNIAVINVKKFSELIEQIDLEVIRNFDSRKTAHLSEPLFELFNIGAMSDDAMAPIEALSIFFDDKNISSIVERLDHEKQNHEMMTLHDLVLLISDADFTLGVDISTIVNEQFNKKGAMKPERNVTMGQDFEVPPIADEVGDGFHHGDLGHENDDLDFVISDEEEGVIVQDGDHITRTLDDDDEDTLDAFSMTGYGDTAPTIDEQIKAISDYDSEIRSDEEITEADVELVANEENLQEEDDPFSAGTAYSHTEESILNLEAEFDAPSVVPSDERNDGYASMGDEEKIGDVSMEDEEIIGDESNVPDMYLRDDEELAAQALRSEDDGIPDISLEDLGAINLDDELHDAAGYETAAEETDPYLTSAVVDELAGVNVVLGDEDEEKPATNDEIDWDKEAEDLVDLGDIDLDDSKDEGSISDLLPAGDNPFNREDTLQPAEELLGQLDLDDFDDEPVKKPSRQNDFPIIEDETPLPQSSRAQMQEPEMEDEEDAVSSEAVISEFGDLNQLLAAADKKKYTKKLFNKNDDAFKRALNVLNGKATWRQASEYIDELFIKYDVDMYSRLAVKFTDDVYQRYAKKK